MASSKGVTVFWDCDDTLYQNDWIVAGKITAKIDDYCTTKLKLEPGKAYALYKKYGTCLRGLMEEKLITTDDDIEFYLKYVHDLNLSKDDIKPHPKLRTTLETIKKRSDCRTMFCFTASTTQHASHCLSLLGIEDVFDEEIIDVRACFFYTKHDVRAFKAAMSKAGIVKESATKEDGGTSTDDDDGTSTEEMPGTDNGISNNQKVEDTTSEGSTEVQENHGSNLPRQKRGVKYPCILIDDSTKNICTAKAMGWTTVLCGGVHRDTGKPLLCDEADFIITGPSDFLEIADKAFALALM
eukprot:g55.t1